jgi:hypothetical protein
MLPKSGPSSATEAAEPHRSRGCHPWCQTRCRTTPGPNERWVDADGAVSSTLMGAGVALERRYGLEFRIVTLIEAIVARGRKPTIRSAHHGSRRYALSASSVPQRQRYRPRRRPPATRVRRSGDPAAETRRTRLSRAFGSAGLGVHTYLPIKFRKRSDEDHCTRRDRDRGNAV